MDLFTKNSVNTKNLLIFHMGSLGDALIVVPSLRALFDHDPNVCIFILTNDDFKNNTNILKQILGGTGWVSRWLEYPTGIFSRCDVRHLVQMFKLYREIRKSRFDVLVYLVRQRSRWARLRDFLFFGAAGIAEIWYSDMPPRLPEEHPGYPLPVLRHQIDRFLDMLRCHGIVIPESEKVRLDVGLTEFEKEEAVNYLKRIRPKADVQWIAVGPGANVPSKRWPIDRYAQVVQMLLANYDIEPIVFGGDEDRLVGDRLVETWRRGHNSAGELGVRIGIAVLEHCALYLGNDTGTMHMAASAGIPCVAVFSGRDYPGLWHPYGCGHVVLRRRLPCEGCMLAECNQDGHPCMSGIGIDDVFSAACGILNRIKRFGTIRPEISDPPDSIQEYSL